MQPLPTPATTRSSEVGDLASRPSPDTEQRPISVEVGQVICIQGRLVRVFCVHRNGNLVTLLAEEPETPFDPDRMWE